MESDRGLLPVGPKGNLYPVKFLGVAVTVIRDYFLED
jgi:hypothetical protein